MRSALLGLATDFACYAKLATLATRDTLTVCWISIYLPNSMSEEFAYEVIIVLGVRLRQEVAS